MTREPVETSEVCLYDMIYGEEGQPGNSSIQRSRIAISTSLEAAPKKDGRLSQPVRNLDWVRAARQDMTCRDHRVQSFSLTSAAPPHLQTRQTHQA